METCRPQPWVTRRRSRLAEYGYISMPRRFSNLALSQWVDELSEADGRAANAAHWEQTACGRRQFCRAERFVGQHAGLTVLERSVRDRRGASWRAAHLRAHQRTRHS